MYYYFVIIISLHFFKACWTESEEKNKRKNFVFLCCYFREESDGIFLVTRLTFLL